MYSFCDFSPTRFIKPARVGETVVIEARTTRCGRRVAFLAAEIRSKEGRQLLAEGWHTKLLMGQALISQKFYTYVNTTLSKKYLSWPPYLGENIPVPVHIIFLSYCNLCNLGVTRSNFVKPGSLSPECGYKNIGAKKWQKRRELIRGRSNFS